VRRAASLLALLLLGVATGACGRDTVCPSGARHAASRAAAWLWTQQAADGGWHSATYGILKSGQALTPFVLCALLDVGPEVAAPPAGAVERAMGFLRASIDGHGRVGTRDPDVLEYPNYATSYALRCFLRVDPSGDAVRVRRMTAYLLSQQYGEERGFSPSDPAYGGWGMGSERKRGDPGHMDIAHTRCVLEALRAAGADPPPMRSRAEDFLRRMLHGAGAGPEDEGGFWFSPVVLSANKSAPRGERFGAYATATCDGLLALLAAGVPNDDARVLAARAWLDRHPALHEVGGIPLDGPTPWSPALLHYHLAARADVERALGPSSSVPFRDRAAAVLLPAQRPDGSFVGDSPLMKEDDPLIATAFALAALR
jgi:hypothetical protein